MINCVVRSVDVNELQLFNIPKYVEELETSDVGVKEAGVVKAVLPPSLRSGGTSLNELLSLRNCKDRFSTSEKQVIVAFEHCPNLYGHHSFGAGPAGGPCTPEEVNAFVNSVMSPTNWKSQETCCTTILNEKGPEALADHFFINVIKTLAERKGQVCKKQKKF